VTGDLNNLFVRAHTKLYQLLGGRGVDFGGRVILLTTTGARSGKQRTLPVMAIATPSGNLAVAASLAGSDSHPQWYHNVLRNPTVSVQKASDQYSATAVVELEPERTLLYELFEQGSDQFTGYKNMTTRVIPVISLRRDD